MMHTAEQVTHSILMYIINENIFELITRNFNNVLSAWAPEYLWGWLEMFQPPLHTLSHNMQ